MHKLTKVASGETEKFQVSHHTFWKVMKQRKVTYLLSVSEETSWQKQVERDKLQVTHHTFCQNEKSYEVMKSNLPTEHKRMHKFTKVASGEREKQISWHNTFGHNDKSYEVMKINLPSEHT